jgi:hypothetical protein
VRAKKNCVSCVLWMGSMTLWDFRLDNMVCDPQLHVRHGASGLGGGTVGRGQHI